MALDWQASVSFASGIALGENAGAFSPRFSLGRRASHGRPTLSQGPAVPPGRADRVRGSACATGADVATSRGLGTSATANVGSDQKVHHFSGPVGTTQE